MEYRKLGRTGLEVSVLCLGSMTWGVQNSESEGHAQVDYALEQGINFIDTAEMYAVPPSAETYGRTEQIIGNWLSARKSRSKIILATKVAGGGIPWIRSGSARINRANILEAVDGSLARLRTDYIDLYQLHWADRETYHFADYWTYDPSKNDRARTLDEFSETLETLQGLVRAGKIRHAGLSNESAWGAMEYLRLAETGNRPRMASIQNEYSLLYRVFEPELAEVAMMEDIGLLAWSPLGTGLLSGKYANGARPAGSRWKLKEPSHRDTQAVHAAVDAYRAVAAKHGLDACQMGLAFVRTRPFVTAAIIGATTMEQLQSNIASADLTLDKAVLDDIDAVRRRFPHPY